ncbi:GDSL-type esterase/lipase family protein [Actinoplanes sp. NEAU-A12]|uniref:GDSL-type esterase/lipase family protein n=1 Tax=Actinoplanes sandaracinus TaxID=3045177 RepID=A0ABT6WQZ3_9ACTN|nr:GDSL-type esterase/lipase family protein [Actinoplanes sandaracinus]MDI6102162.1 GDSL-type esterase/lipase family protein [Actinoplanes sandaracinus]
MTDRRSFIRAGGLLAGGLAVATATAGPASAAAPAAALPLLSWHAALANRRYAPAVIAVLGSSSSESVGATGLGRGYAHVLVENLRSMFPVAGASGGDNYVAAWGTPEWWPVVSHGGGTRSKTAGWGLKAVDLTGAGQTLTYAFIGTSAQVWYSISGSGRFSVTVDGVTVAASVGGGAPVGRDAQWTSSALAPGRHTIVVTCLDPGARIHGFATFDGDADRGIHLYNGGHGGRTSGDFASGVDAWAPRLRTVRPHLVILQLGVNDWRIGVPAAVMKENLQTIIAAVRAHTDTDPSFVVYGPPRVTADRRAQDFAHFTEAWREIAAEDTGGHGGGSGVAYFDLAARQVSPTSDNSLGLYCDDLLHMSDKGAAFTADALAAFLAP